ncbi:MAG: signal peptidase I [Candidatus Bathyarchaeia archaeon]
MRALAKLVFELLLPVLVFFGALYAMRFILKTEHPVLIVAIDMPVWYETSMYPVLTAGDVVFMEGVPPEEIKVGDVIAFYKPYGGEDLIIHRVISIVTDDDGTRRFKTKGDFNWREDPYLVSGENIVGRWTGFKLQFLGLVVLAAQTTLVRAIIIFALLVMILFSFKDRLKGTQKADGHSDPIAQSMPPNM